MIFQQGDRYGWGEIVKSYLFTATFLRWNSFSHFIQWFVQTGSPVERVIVFYDSPV